MNEIDPKALFRLSVLGPLISRERLERGELQHSLRELAAREYAIPGSRRRHLGEKTIQGWYSVESGFMRSQRRRRRHQAACRASPLHIILVLLLGLSAFDTSPRRTHHVGLFLFRS